MSEFSGVRRLVWVPVLVGLAATTLTGCKKTTHAAKPLANISQAVVASATSSTAAVATPATAPAAVSSASVSASPSVASLSASSSPNPTPTAAAAAGAGCALVSAATVAQLLGVGSVTTVVHPTVLRAPVVAHEGCQYSAGTTAAGFDINTFSGGLQVPALVAQAMSRVPGIKSVTIDGNPGFSAVIAGTEEEASFTKGQQDVVVLTNGKAGAALALATLIGNQL